MRRDNRAAAGESVHPLGDGLAVRAAAPSAAFEMAAALELGVAVGVGVTDVAADGLDVADGLATGSGLALCEAREDAEGDAAGVAERDGLVRLTAGCTP